MCIYYAIYNYYLMFISLAARSSTPLLWNQNYHLNQWELYLKADLHLKNTLNISFKPEIIIKIFKQREPSKKEFSWAFQKDVVFG